MTEFYNSQTKLLDKYLHRKIRESVYADWNRTYLWLPEVEKAVTERQGGTIAFRVPGATRGHITVDKDLVITDIEFYESTCFGRIGCYRHRVREAGQKLIGRKLDTDGLAKIIKVTGKEKDT